MASEAGKRPKMATIDVMRIGRRRSSAPATIASSRPMPCPRRVEIQRTMSTPSMIATPNSAVKPTALDMFRCMPRTYRASTPPMQAKGTASSTTTAARRESNVTHSSTKIRPIVMGIRIRK